MSAEGDTAFATHLARWRASEPEMQFAEAFVPVAWRPRFQAWGTLLAELEHSLLAPSDPQLATQRLAWWHGELRASEPQHPVARALRDAGLAPGRASGVAGAAALLAEDERSPADLPEALQRLDDFGTAVLAVERELFPLPPSGDDGRVVALGALVRWLPLLPQLPRLRELLPLGLLARHPVDAGGPVPAALARDLAGGLRPLQPVGQALPLYRALRWRFDQARLRQLARGRVPQPRQCIPAPAGATWLAWRVARNCRTSRP